MLTITLAYCTDDQTAALRIAENISTHVDFNYVPVGKANEGPLLADLLSKVESPVLLLLSDAFLTNPNCMLNGHDMLNDEQPFLPIIVRSRRYDELADEVIEAETNLNNQSDVMHYVNHWQDRYIDLRTQADELSISGGEAFQSYLRKIRETSTQAEEFLYALKAKGSVTEQQLAANDYEELFLFAERPRLWEEFRSFAQEPVDVSGIPGLEMLGNAGQVREELPAEQPQVEEGDGAQVQGEVEKQGETEVNPAAIIEGLAASIVSINGEDAEVLPIAGANNENPVITASDSLAPEEQAASWVSRAWALFDAQEGPAGLDLLAAGQDALPEHPVLAYNYALLLVTSTGDITGGRSQLEALLQQFPEHSDSLFLAGELAEAQQDFTTARAYWEELSDAEPLYPDLNYRLGGLLDDQFPEEGLEAAAYLRRATKDEEAPADAFFRYGRLLAGELGRPKKAIRQLKKAVELDPENAAVHFTLAEVLLERGKKASASNAFLTASRLNAALDTENNRALFLAEPDDAAEASLSDDDHQVLLSLQAKVAALEEQLARQPPEAEQAPDAKQKPRPGTGKTVFISGATSGIGRATARRLAADGYRLILLGRRAERLREVSQELEKAHDIDTLTIQADVRHRGEIRTAIINLPEEWKSIDVLLNNAGKAKGFDPIHTGNYEHWDEMIDVNLKGLLTLTREVSPLMVARETGTIINVCSTAGKEVYANGNVYCATKHAVDALTYAMRLDLVKYGIRVGQICPAHVEETEFAVVRFDGDAERAKIYNDFQPLRSRDVADAIHFMISQPAHVNIMDVVLQGTQQASSTVVDRSGRDKFAPEEE